MSNNPITREEMFLSAAAGNDVPLPEPITRTEKYLKAIADNASNNTGSDDGGSSGGGVLIVHADTTTYALDKTWQEITSAGFAVLIMAQNGLSEVIPLVGYGFQDDEYLVRFDGFDDYFVAHTETDYPVYSDHK